MGETADELRQEIDAKRSDATRKIEEIEQRVTGAADEVKEQVTGLPDQMKDQVASVTEQVKEKFDWRKQVDERPLASVGIAFLGGALLGGMLGGDDDEPKRERSRDRRYGEAPITPARGGYAYRYSSGTSRESGSGGMKSMIRNAAKSSGIDTTLSAMTGTLMASASDQLKHIAEQNFPGFMEKLEQKNAERSREAGEGGSSDDPSRAHAGRETTSHPTGSMRDPVATATAGDGPYAASR
jgi:ElaB/YqjD/DUF883 family membrane-anchored ribosome-binding protein